MQSYDSAGEDFVLSEETAKLQLASRFARLESYLPNQGRLLDIGASRGVFLNQAREQGWNISGLEAGLDSIAHASSRYGIAIEHGTLEEANFEEESYDCVHMSHVLEHLLDPLQGLNKIHRSMKSRGVLVIEVPFEFGDLFDRFRELLLRRQRAMNTVPSSHLFFFTLSSLRRLLETTGFEILHGCTPRRNQSFDSKLPLGIMFKRAVYHCEQQLQMGPLIEVFAKKR
jgi:SAM-dependent methyltransferase